MDDHLPGVAAVNSGNTVLLGARNVRPRDGNQARMSLYCFGTGVGKSIPYMNHGRWVVECPSLVCGGAERVLPWQALVVCVCRDRDFCQHPSPCGTIIQLDWPADWQQIQTVMADRSIINRNWVPGETVEQLRGENMAYGLDGS